MGTAVVGGYAGTFTLRFGKETVGLAESGGGPAMDLVFVSCCSNCRYCLRQHWIGVSGSVTNMCKICGVLCSLTLDDLLTEIFPRSLIVVQAHPIQLGQLQYVSLVRLKLFWRKHHWERDTRWLRISKAINVVRDVPRHFGAGVLLHIQRSRGARESEEETVMC